MRKELYALIDCSTFYCSCERAFRPELTHRPVCVLSNNDGCVIALTPEVKELGIRMGTPYFQIKNVLKEKNVAVFSSNYCLYADMSRRVLEIIRRFSDDVEQYSIDEAFVRLEADESNVEAERERLKKLADDMHLSILKGTGIPVRVSIAETKTLAKVGSDYAKKLLKAGKLPCVVFWEHTERDTVLRELAIQDVWGIGRQWSHKLRERGINTAYALAHMDPALVRTAYNVVMERTVRELRGIPCIPLEHTSPPKKSIVRSRMFSQKIHDPHLIMQAISTHTMRAAEKLRHDRLMTQTITIFVTTGPHAEHTRTCSASVLLTRPTNDSLVLNDIAHRLFEGCFVSHTRSRVPYPYTKAGVMFSGLISGEARATPLFFTTRHEHPELMEAIDALNQHMGRNTLVFGSMGTPDALHRVHAAKKGTRGWSMKREYMSPRYTTLWDELLEVTL